jgi:hypothetical protein
MARQTTCTTVDRAWDGVPGVPLAMGIIGVIGLILAPVYLAIAALFLGGITPASMVVTATVLMFACLFAINLLHQVRDYIFDHRLICLDGDRCALARVTSLEDNGDGDKSMNTILAPANEKTPPDVYDSFFQVKELVRVDAGLATRGWHLDPHAARKPPWGLGLPLFHCEIEGTWFDEITTATLAWLWTIFALAVVALAAGAAATALGPLAWAIWIAVALLVILAILLINLFGGGDTSEVDAGPVGDATPSPTGPIITDIGGQTIKANDLVALIGRHVCDSGHNAPCWDELHTVTGIAKIQQRDYDAVPAVHSAGDIYDQYCRALTDFVTGVGRVRQELNGGGDGGGDGDDTVPCLEHPRIG